jgi:hypothetical protein
MAGKFVPYIPPVIDAFEMNLAQGIFRFKRSVADTMTE